MNKLFNKLRKTFNSSESLFSLVSVIAATFACIASIRSCQVATDANNLTKKHRAEDAYIVLEATFDKNKDTMALKPIDGISKLIDSQIYFDEKLKSTTIYTRLPDNIADLTEIKKNVQKSINSNCKTRSSKLIFSESHNMAIIESTYIAHGNRLRDRSAYRLISSRSHEGDECSVETSFTNLIFMKRLNPQGDVNTIFKNSDLLLEIWSQ